MDSDDPTEEHINERVHWSVVCRHQTVAKGPYNPPNLPSGIPADKIATMTDEERELLGSRLN
jgi:hypothetical protein